MSLVPPIYHGLWQRTLYAEPAQGEPEHIDDDTQVFWLQAGDWHADLRVPANRPDFAGIDSLDECSRDQLQWLAGQTAFAGITRVQGPFCTWHRLVDLSPGLEKDIGVMRFIDDDTLEECHPSGIYREVWRRMSVGERPEPIVERDASGLPRWLQYGDHAMAIDAGSTVEHEPDLFAHPSELSTAALKARMAVNIRYVRRRGATWEVRLSTRPWQEKRPLVA